MAQLELLESFSYRADIGMKEEKAKIETFKVLYDMKSAKTTRRKRFSKILLEVIR